MEKNIQTEQIEEENTSEGWPWGLVVMTLGSAAVVLGMIVQVYLENHK